MVQEKVFNVGLEELRFVQVELVFEAHAIQDIFTLKNNKTLIQTLTHARYQHLTDDRLISLANLPLGSVLHELKASGDERYRRLLNKHGDEVYCRFYITEYLKCKGLYAFLVGEKLTYIGKTKKTFQQRINTGYGRIAPKNCYLDGQSTNCHLNSLINQHWRNVQFYVHLLELDTEIDRLEVALIQTFQPEWNIQLKG